MLSLVPRRHRDVVGSLERYAAMLCGVPGAEGGPAGAPLEVRSWLDDELAVVPELEPGMRARLDAERVFGEMEDAHEHGFEPYPVLLGPVSFLLHARTSAADAAPFASLSHLESVLDAYAALLMLLGEDGTRWVQLDEPSLGPDLSAEVRDAFSQAFSRLSTLTSRPAVVLTGSQRGLAGSLGLAAHAGFECLHVDLVQAPGALTAVLAALPPRAALAAGVVPSGDPHRTDFDRALSALRQARAVLGPDHVLVAPTCQVAAQSLPTERRDDSLSVILDILKRLARASGLREP